MHRIKGVRLAALTHAMLQTGLLNLAPFDPLGLRNDRNRQAEVSPYLHWLT